MEDKATIGMYGAAVVDRLVLDLRVGTGDIHLRQDFSEIQFQRTINHNAHRTVAIVCANIGHCLDKVGVGQGRHCNQKMVGQIEVHGLRGL